MIETGCVGPVLFEIVRSWMGWKIQTSSKPKGRDPSRSSQGEYHQIDN